MVAINHVWTRLLVLGVLYAMSAAQTLVLRNICNDLTVIILTSPTVSSPNITLVNAVYEHLRQVPCLSFSQFLVSLHTKPDDLRPSTQLYEKRLYAWQTEMSNVKLLVWRMNNAEVAITSAIQTVKTKYYLFWEHDWLFCRRVSMEAILLEMEATSNINYVRFNKMVNIPRPPPRSDIVLIPCIRCRFVSLMFTPSWSNNPHIAKRDFFIERCARLLNQNADARTRPGFVESAITAVIRKDLHSNGAEAAEDMWGTYVYGQINEETMLRHINGRRFHGPEPLSIAYPSIIDEGGCKPIVE